MTLPKLAFKILSANVAVTRKPNYNFACLKLFRGQRVLSFIRLSSSSSSSVSRVGFNDYEKEKREFNYAIPEKFNFARDVLDVWAKKEKTSERSTDVPSFWYVYEDGNEIKWSYGELAEKSKKVSNILEKKCGLKKGDSLLILLPKIPEYWLVNIAAIRTGVVVSPGSMQLRAKDLEYRFGTLKPKCIIAEESIADVVDTVVNTCETIQTKVLVSSSGKQKSGWIDFGQLYESSSSEHQCVSTASDDSMMIFFTSGTTGMPKMVEHTHASYGIGLSYFGRYCLDLTEKNIFWSLSDTGWAKSAYGNIFGPWSRGACVFIHQMTKFQPSVVVEVLSKYPIDTLCAPPSAYRMVLQENLPEIGFPHLEQCLSAGEAATGGLIQSWMKTTGLKLYEGYGQTETVACTTMFRCIDYKPGSIGKQLPGMNLVILDEDGNELGPNKHGEIAIKRKPVSPVGLFRQYKNDPEQTALKLSDSYYKTGDLCYYDEDGYFWFVSRNDDITNSAGYRIGPHEVENVLNEHPSVMEAAVVSSPDEIRGEEHLKNFVEHLKMLRGALFGNRWTSTTDNISVVKAFVVLTKEYSDCDKHKLVQELQNYVKNVTAPYKYPRKIEFVEALPRTVSGKVKRFELRNKEWNRN